MGIQLSIYYPHPVPMLNYYKKKYKYSKNNFLNSSKIAYNSISFPIAPHIKFKDIDYMVKQIKMMHARTIKITAQKVTIVHPSVALELYVHPVNLVT